MNISKEFDLYDRNKVIEMLQFEQRIRYSQEIQDIYTKMYLSGERIPIEREIQRYTLREFGYRDDDATLQQYWLIPRTYADDSDVVNSAFYIKLNIMMPTKFNIGDPIVNTTLINYTTGKDAALTSLEHAGRPMVILAGSMT